MKIDKYDRQVRIWGSKGQKKLTLSKAAIIGCEGASIQAAKNLILPGIGRIDIFDDKTIEVQDLSSSFFYTHEAIGKLKGEQASRNLLEMNSDVEGGFVNVSVQKIIESPLEYLGGYDIVICTNLTECQNQELSKICWSNKIPVIFGTSLGFFFHVRSQKQVHIVESENISAKKYFLRLHNPFRCLQEYAKSKNLPQLISNLRQNQQTGELKKQLQQTFSKITYPVFLIQSFRLLKEKLNRFPKTHEVKELLMEWKNLVIDDLDIRNGINEALTRTFDLYQTYDNFMPDLDIFDDPNVINATKDHDFIYVFLKAVKQFMVQNEKNLPQIVRLPDISTSTKDYIEFKNIYKAEHENHKLILKSIIQKLFPGYQVDDQLLSEYINNIDALKIVKMRPYFEQLQNPDTVGSSIDYLGDAKSLFVALKAYKIFQKEEKRPPNPNDLQKIIKISRNLTQKWHLTEIDQRFLRQICRYEGKRLISYDSMAGAIIGQQAVKLLTNCFTPMNNGYFFDGLHCKGYTLTL